MKEFLSALGSLSLSGLVCLCINVLCIVLAFLVAYALIELTKARPVEESLWQVVRIGLLCATHI